MLYNQITHNAPSLFLKEIPGRLIQEEWASRPAAPATPAIPQRTPRNLSFGTPGMAAARPSALNIPGVQKGFAPSPARSLQANTVLFRPGDKVLHRKFGEGTVQSVTGTGADARIMIAFTAYGTREFSLSIAPIVKIET